MATTIVCPCMHMIVLVLKENTIISSTVFGQFILGGITQANVNDSEVKVRSSSLIVIIHVVISYRRIQ